MKQCTKCKEFKSGADFQKRAASKDGLHSWCKSCKRNHEREHYAQNSYRKQYLSDKRKELAEKTKAYIFEYLLKHPCVDCGELDPVVLEFDHVNGDKRGNIAELKWCSMETVIEEISKCEVRCANCHRRKTAIQFNWFKMPPSYNGSMSTS